jgi:hypothetical protein
MMNSTWRAYTLRFALIIAGVLFPFLLFGQQSAPDPGVMPDGWYVYRTKAFHLLINTCVAILTTPTTTGRYQVTEMR